MDDLEFRRRCIIDPFDQDKDFLLCKQRDPEHTRFAQQQAQFHRSLQVGMERVEVPEGLAARVQLRHSLRQRKIRRRIWVRGVALAASILAAIGLGLIITANPTDLQEIVLAHVYTELIHLNDRKDVQINDLTAVLNEIGHGLREDLGQVHYANTCLIRKSDGAHLIVSGKMGPVTVLLMPNERITHRFMLNDKRFTGVLTPTPGGGMAIVGEQGETLQAIEDKIRSSVLWAT